MTGHDDISGSLRILAVHLRRLGLRTRMGPGPVLEVTNPLAAAVSTTVDVAGGAYVAFDGMMLAPMGEPHAAASRLAHLLGLVRS